MVGDFLRCPALAKENCVEKHISRAQASVSVGGSTVVKMFCGVKHELPKVVPKRTGLGDCLLVFGGVISFGHVLVLPWIGAARDRDSLAVLVSVENQALSLWRFRKGFKSPRKHLSKNRMPSTMPI